MLKKLLTFIVVIVLSIGTLTGCNLITTNTYKDYRQSVIVVAPITKTRGNDTFTSKERNVYKYELVNIYNSQYSNLSSQYSTNQEMFDYIVEQLTNRELIMVEVESRFHFGDLVWYNGDASVGGDYRDLNAVIESVYEGIDSQLETIRAQVYKDHNEKYEAGANAEDSTETTYPTKTETVVEDEEDEAKIELELYKIKDYYKDGMTSKEISLEKEVMNRFLNLLENNLKSDTNLAVFEDKEADLQASVKKMKDVLKTEGADALYKKLYGGTEADNKDIKVAIDFLYGTSAINSRKIEKLQEYLESEAKDVSEEDILKEYRKAVQLQESLYKNDSDGYIAAIKEDASTILYHVNTGDTKLFFVKHILVPFSDAQTALLNKEKVRLNIDKNNMSNYKQYADYRDALALGITSYEHRDGEDYGNPLTLTQISNDIVRQMTEAEANTKDAARTFDDLIYKYNTDPGIFTNTLGYVAQYKTTGTYMQEFQDGADILYKDYKVGQLLKNVDGKKDKNYVVTDYGVHFMFYYGELKEGTTQLTDYTTIGRYETVYDQIKTDLTNNWMNIIFENWQETALTAYTHDDAGIVTVNSKTLKNLL